MAPPIYTSSTYARDENYVPKLKENYIRNGSPTLWQAEAAIAALEQGEEALALCLRHGGDHDAAARQSRMAPMSWPPRSCITAPATG